MRRNCRPLLLLLSGACTLQIQHIACKRQWPGVENGKMRQLVSIWKMGTKNVLDTWFFHHTRLVNLEINWTPNCSPLSWAWLCTQGPSPSVDPIQGPIR